MSLTLISIASVLCGYLAVVLSYLILTMLMTRMMPRFVMQKGIFTSGYLVMHFLLWAACGLIGGFIATLLPSHFPYIVSGVLGLLVTALIITKQGQLGRFRIVQALLALAGIGGGTLLSLATWGATNAVQR